MADSHALEHDDMDRLTQHWRSRPNQLRQAITAARTQYQAAPKLGRGFQAGDYLTGESKGGTTLLGIVVAGECGSSEISAAVETAAGFVDQHRNAFPPKKSGRRRGPNVRLEVFVPPGVYPDQPSSVQGVPVQWFQWVPVSEDEVRVEKLTTETDARTVSTGSGTSTIGRLLGHLKWLTETARNAAHEKPPIGWAFRVYSGTVQLAFYAAFTPEAQAMLASAQGRKFASVVDSLMTVGMKATKPLRTPEGLAAARDMMIRHSQRDELVEAADKVLKHALKSGLVHEITAERQRDFEAAPDVAALLRALQGDGKAAEERHQAATAALQGDPELADLCRAIAGVVAARSPMVTGEVRPAIQAAAQEMATGFLGVAVENLPKRHKVIGKAAGTLVKSLTALSSEDAGPA